MIKPFLKNNNIFHKTLKTKGFTLVELVLYVGLSSIILLTISAFLGTLLDSRIKNQTVAEVEGQGIQVVGLISQTIRNSESIISPNVGASGTSLSLDVIDINNDPTIFDLSSGVVRIEEGANPIISLTNSRIIASGLTFSNLSRLNTPGSVYFEFTLTHINPDGRNVYSYSKKFIGAASLRHP